MLRDGYLDADVASDRRQAWAARLGAGRREFGFIAEAEAGPVGFVYMLSGVDATWGTLIDNLHVMPGFKGRGIGRRLLEAAARNRASLPRASAFILFVFEANIAARRFYASVGGPRSRA